MISYYHMLKQTIWLQLRQIRFGTSGVWTHHFSIMRRVPYQLYHRNKTWGHKGNKVVNITVIVEYFWWANGSNWAALQPVAGWNIQQEVLSSINFIPTTLKCTRKLLELLKRHRRMFVLFESIKIRGKEGIRLAQLVACRLADPAIPVQTLVREIIYTD